MSDGTAPAVQQAVAVTVANQPDAPQGPASLAGQAITADYISGGTATTLHPAAGARQTATVSTGAGSVEFPTLPSAGSGTGNGSFGLAAVDLSAQQIRIEFPLDPTAFPGAFTAFAPAASTPFQGVRLTDADDSLPTIRAVTIAGQQGFTNQVGAAQLLTASDLTVTADGILLNVAGKGRMADADPNAAGRQASFVLLSVDLNDAPVATAKSLVAAQNSALAIDAATLRAGATDADGDTLSLSRVFGAVNGTASFDAATGVVTFTPATGFAGTASFGYEVADAFGGSGTATATVTVNAAPSVAPIAAAPTNEDAAPVQINLLAGATDPEGNTLTVLTPVTATSSNAARTVAVTLASGVLTLNPAQFGDLVAAQSEVVTVSYLVSDGINPGVSNTATITVEGRNETLTGTSAANTLTGGEGPDTIRGLGGNDTLRGNGGNDTLDGGTGTDTVDGGNGDDTLMTRNTEAQADSMIGGSGTDTLSVSGTSDIVLNGTGTITGIEIFDGGGNALRGTSAVNVLDLSAFTTVSNLAGVLGLAGNDTLTGSAGSDTLDGGTNVDVVSGGGGDDTILVSGNQAQTDTMEGGAGQDRILVNAAGGDFFIVSTQRISGMEHFDGAGMAVGGTTGANVLDFSGIACSQRLLDPGARRQRYPGRGNGRRHPDRRLWQ